MTNEGPDSVWINPNTEEDGTWIAADVREQDVDVKYTRTVWQPIETAPELEDVLIRLSDGRCVVAYLGDGSRKHAIGWHFNYYSHTFLSANQPPTHWMPLPTPPETET